MIYHILTVGKYFLHPPKKLVCVHPQPILRMIYQSLATSGAFKSAMLHGSISHLVFFNKKHHRKASGFLQDSPGLGGEANPPWNRTPPTENLRSQKEEGHEKSGGSIEAAGGGYVFKTWELKELKKNWGGSTWNSCIEIFYTRYDLLFWWWYDIWGNKSYGKWCEGEVLNLWNITTIMFRGFEVFFALFIFSVWALIFCDNMLCFFDPQKTSRTLWIAFTTGHSFFKFLTYHVIIVFGHMFLNNPHVSCL